jgi:hypothetical protein
MTVKIKPSGSSRYRTQFIGRGGRLLAEAIEPRATYTFNDDEGYVRAKVLESDGRVAWVQPWKCRAVRHPPPPRSGQSQR